MLAELVRRSQYFIPPSTECLHSGRNHFEDWQEFHLPMARMHHANLHEWGIASGLTVTVVGAAIEVQPGVAVDGNGELIALAATGQADISLDQPGEAGQQIVAPFRLSTAGQVNQNSYLTIQFAQRVRFAEGSCGKLEQTPWLRLQPTSGPTAYVNDGTAIILAIVKVNGGGAVTVHDLDALLPHRRRLISVTAEALRIQRTTAVTGSAEETVAARIEPILGGGLQVTVAETGDTILFGRQGGGNFSTLTVHANDLQALGHLHTQGDLQVQGHSAVQGNLTVSGTSTFLGQVGISGAAGSALLTVGNGANQDLLRLNAQQAWLITAAGAGGTSSLDVRAQENNSLLRITTADGANAPLQIRVNNSSAANRVYLVPTGGRVGIGTAEPSRPLTIEAANGAYLNVRTTEGAQEVLLGADAAGGIVSTMTNHDLQLRAGGNATKMIIKANGNVGIGTAEPSYSLDIKGALRVSEELYLPNSSGRFAVFTNQTFNNEASFVTNNIKLSLAHSGRLQLFPGTPLAYEFMIGNTREARIFQGNLLQFVTVFDKRFSINQAGDLYCAGSKAGYVVDHFVNRVGDVLEQGDVVVVSQQNTTQFTGADNNIPLLEVDLTTQAYDSRVCGIVAKVVTARELPFVEFTEPPLPPELEQADAAALTHRDGMTVDAPLARHPLHNLAAHADPALDRTKVQADQMGQMVTLGAFAHCKVDADISPIAVGDLLTTSPTKGHAQKVLAPDRALGAIIGKALGSLAAGRGKIPVLVMLQ